jgi:PadR family transcriptional regulator, regulatory protein AphA
MKETTTLSTSSYVILGLIETCGPLTPYELKKRVDESIGYFWDFPRAQLYVDPERLVHLGYLQEEREAEGRRRRTFHITNQGREVIIAWMRDTTPIPVELRDTGLLKLYFGALADIQNIQAIATEQVNMHLQRLHEYEELVQRITPLADTAFMLATLRMGLRYEEMSIAFWEDIAQRPPRIDSEKDRRASDTLPNG